MKSQVAQQTEPSSVLVIVGVTSHLRHQSSKTLVLGTKKQDLQLNDLTG